MADIIQRLNCIETPIGYVLAWDIAEGVEISRTTVYGLNGAREFIIESPLVTTGRCVVGPEHYAMLTGFKVSVVSRDGEVEVSDPIVPQRMVKHERLLLKDMRHRAAVYMKSSPIGSYPCTLLLRRIDGPACHLCGSTVCSGRGGEAVSDYCPECLGTGIEDPFYVYPEKELLHGISPRDDQDVSQPAVQRSHIVRSFQSIFDLQLKAGDVFVTGQEVYRVAEQSVPASVGNVPVYYNLTAMKYAPEDPRYKRFMSLAYGGCDYA